MTPTEPTVTQNTARHRFELATEGKLSVVVYEAIDNRTLALMHTEVHPDLEGRGIGTKLVQQTLTYIEQKGLKIVPLCPFIVTYLKRHPEWQRIVTTQYEQNDF